MIARMPFLWGLNRHIPPSVKTFLRPMLGAQDPPEIQEAFRDAMPRTGNVAIDVGANVGETTKLLLSRFRRVYAYEPLWNKKLAWLAANPACIVHWQAVGSATGSLLVAYRRGQFTTTTQEFAGWGPVQELRYVPVTTLDFDFRLARELDFIKIDTEGFEVAVCEGAKWLVNRCKPTLFIEIHKRDNGPFIEGMFPFLTWRELRHPSYAVNSDNWKDHYWILGTS